MKPLAILHDAWFFYCHNLGQIARLTLPLLALEAIAHTLLASQLGEHANPAYGVLLSVVFYPLYSAPLMLFLQARSAGQRPGSAALLAAGLQCWPRFALLSGLSTVLILFGLSLFVIPGIWLMVRLAFAEPCLVVRQMSPLRALQASAKMTEGRFWLVFSCLSSVLVPLWLLDEWTQPAAPDLVLGVLQQTLSGFLQLFALVVVFRVFMLLPETD